MKYDKSDFLTSLVPLSCFRVSLCLCLRLRPACAALESITVAKSDRSLPIYILPRAESEMQLAALSA
jgi:hypothetical protein